MNSFAFINVGGRFLHVVLHRTEKGTIMAECLKFPDCRVTAETEALALIEIKKLLGFAVAGGESHDDALNGNP